MKTAYTFNLLMLLNELRAIHYLRCVNKQMMELWFGGNLGEVCILCTDNAEKLENCIKAVIYP